jgi:cyclopropane fatty-acyl-phospholipid synthase-like methyltransferase
MDVPSPIDFSKQEEAEAWAASANAKRPWRRDFFTAIVAELQRLGTTPLSVLQLGSGPGFLAEAVVHHLPRVCYTLLDSSLAMHHIARARIGSSHHAQFITADFRGTDWVTEVGLFDAVVTVQAVHELRHKRHAAGLHRLVHGCLRPEGVYFVCDHVIGPEGMTDPDLYMTETEQHEALALAGFREIRVVLEKKGLILFRAAA